MELLRVGDGCAPSKNAINPRFKILAETLLAAGYVIIAPDYEGLGTPGVHPYLNLSSESKICISRSQSSQKALWDSVKRRLDVNWSVSRWTCLIGYC